MSLLDDAYMSEPEYFVGSTVKELGCELDRLEVARKHDPDLLLQHLAQLRQYQSDLLDILHNIEEIAEEYEAQEEERFYHEMAR